MDRKIVITPAAIKATLARIVDFLPENQVTSIPRPLAISPPFSSGREHRRCAIALTAKAAPNGTTRMDAANQTINKSAI